MSKPGHLLVAFVILSVSTQAQGSGLFGLGVSIPRPFDVDHVRNMFSQALQTDSQGNTVVLLENYVAAYTELTRVFEIFGVVFHFARNDILNHLSTLRNLRTQDRSRRQNNYHTFESMFAYEYSQFAQHLGQPGVSRNLNIHRALRFISLVIDEVKQEDDSDLAARVRTRYFQTLAPHHNWLVRMAATMALQSFPSRSRFLRGVNVRNDASGMTSLTSMNTMLDQIYNHIQGLYDQYAE
ncbi:ceramide-1-phosphate transfer protein [Plakobranchus ocellatus]|uniref:Ceramide-1-phosphate transfer protein n=1 Tax=Plakobranchus ocellatus TaxID=259542 RepID=A0AAV4C2W5_9GAST|nr:ceramide-1-phosphate transfer protein [Plakobranchus ocellatus]